MHVSDCADRIVGHSCQFSEAVAWPDALNRLKQETHELVAHEPLAQRESLHSLNSFGFACIIGVTGNSRFQPG